MPVDSIPVHWTLRGAIVTLPSEVDAANIEQVREALDDTLRAAPAVLVADMTCTTYCCSEGLRVLIETHQAARRAHISLRIAGADHPHVQRLLTLTGVISVLDVYPHTEAALAETADRPGTHPDRARPRALEE